MSVSKHLKELLLPTFYRVPKKLREPIKNAAQDLLRPGRQKKISIIVPVYNVEEYLSDCLDSILAQTHRNLEVVCVDDGSPDNSIDILRAYAAKDRRIKVVRKANGGLGAARNTGVKNSTGEMICFVDSDDTLPPRAIENLLTSLMRTGSDFAVGSIMRDTPTGKHVPNWAQQLHASTRTRMTLVDEPDVIKNVFACTKMFRREFFLDVVGGYPGGLYEDQVPSAKAYKHGTFDIIKDVVYYWRIRDDESSITQQKGTMKDLTGRWVMIGELTEQLADTPFAVQRALQAKIVGFDMRPYYEQVPRTDDEYWEFLQERVQSFVDSCGYDLLTNVPVIDRLQAAAVYHGYRGDVAELLRRRESRTWKVPGVVEDGIPKITDEYFQDLELRPDGVVEVLNAPKDVVLVQYVESVAVGTEEVVIRGSAYLTNISQTEAGSTITLIARATDSSNQVRPYRLTRYSEPATDLRASDPWNDHADSGFEAIFSLDELGHGWWDLEITLDIGGVSRTAPLAEPDCAAAGRLPAFGALANSCRWYMLHRRSTGGLQLRRTVTPQLGVEALWTEGDKLNVRLSESMQIGKGRFVAISGTTRVPGALSIRDEHAVVSFKIPSASQFTREWKLWWLYGRHRVQMAWTNSSQAVNTARARPYLMRSSAAGNIILQSRPIVGEVSNVTLTESGLKVKGWFYRHPSLYETKITAALYSQSVVGSSVPIDTYGGGFEVILPLVSDNGNPLSRTRGYAFVLETKGINRVWLRVSEQLLSAFPVEDQCNGTGMTLTATPRARALWVRLRNTFSQNECTHRAQHLLQTAYGAQHEPIEAVLFEAFNGKAVTDAPLALSRELQRRGSTLVQYWSIESLTTPVPEWATPLLRYSKRWYEVLASARFLVNNNNWPWFFSKRSYQTYLQTWHGTPLKKIGNDVPGANLSLTYRSLMIREAAAWDYLLAQNEYAARIFPSAFGYDGEVLQLGYPRNDTLVDSAAQATRGRVRANFGIAENTRVLLYAPTWRDNHKGIGGYGRVSFLDFDALQAGAKEEFVVLYRGHSNTAEASGTLPDGVLDVTRYSDVNELMLASDALVTDYSSIFFDYAVMRKPIYFLVPDLKRYSCDTRGFYMPLEEVAPGPLCSSTAELTYELNQDYESNYGKRLNHFIATYAPQDDGYAAGRVLDALELSFLNSRNKRPTCDT